MKSTTKQGYLEVTSPTDVLLQSISLMFSFKCCSIERRKVSLLQTFYKKLRSSLSPEGYLIFIFLSIGMRTVEYCISIVMV